MKPYDESSKAVKQLADGFERVLHEFIIENERQPQVGALEAAIERVERPLTRAELQKRFLRFSHHFDGATQQTYLASGMEDSEAAEVNL